MVCESGGLRNYVVPGLFFIIGNRDDIAGKTGIRKLTSYAGRIIETEMQVRDLIGSIEAAGNRRFLR